MDLAVSKVKAYGFITQLICYRHVVKRHNAHFNEVHVRLLNVKRQHISPLIG